MPLASCSFKLNSKETSFFYCPTLQPIVSFSGKNAGRDNPAYASKAMLGPIPPGTYYIVDRQSGGHLGMIYDLWDTYGYGTTDRTKWFALWNTNTKDITVVDGVKRGSFRLHPMGPLHLSDGCITIVKQNDFDRLANYLHNGHQQPVPGKNFLAYGTVTVTTK